LHDGLLNESVFVGAPLVPSIIEFIVASFDHWDEATPSQTAN
jgi:hypothetical protein